MHHDHQLCSLDFQNKQTNKTLQFKVALDKFNIIPQLFQKKLGFLYH